MMQPVQWAAQVEGLYEAGARVFVEIGPRGVLTGLVGSILGERSHVAIALDAGPEGSSAHELRAAVVQLRVLGLRLGDIDPYRRPDERAGGAADGRAPRLTVRLNGANYVSDRTAAIYEATLARTPPPAMTVADKEPTDVTNTNG